MRLKDCFQSSEDPEIKTLRSFSFNNQSSFQKTNQLPFLEKAWLHSYGRNASNVAKYIGLLKDKYNEEALGWSSRNLIGSIPGTSDNDTSLWCN